MTEKIVFQDGSSFPTSVNNLHIDCSSDGLAAKPPCPIFQEKKIILQATAYCQQVYSASVIAALEVNVVDDDDKKNKILTPVPHPEYIEDWPKIMMDTQRNEERNSKEGSGFLWLRNNRLSPFYHLPWMAILKFMYLAYKMPLVPKLQSEQFHVNRK